MTAADVDACTVGGDRPPLQQSQLLAYLDVTIRSDSDNVRSIFPCQAVTPQSLGLRIA